MIRVLLNEDVILGAAADGDVVVFEAKALLAAGNQETTDSFTKKSVYFTECFLIPKPSEPNNKTLFPDHLTSVKFFLPDESKPYIQKLLSLKNLRVVLILDTLNISTYSRLPLAALYISLLSEGKDLSLTMSPSKLKEAALLINDPIFLGSVTSSMQTKFKFFLFCFINSFSG